MPGVEELFGPDDGWLAGPPGQPQPGRLREGTGKDGSSVQAGPLSCCFEEALIPPGSRDERVLLAGQAP